ncbi:hypothetical protein [Marinoscillum sp.]|uniref:hypothetical protein n=1 Tax=Marinoscillum sp. TaxID=2024838 RepID=UPI003BA97BA5
MKKTLRLLCLGMILSMFSIAGNSQVIGGPGSDCKQELAYCSWNSGITWKCSPDAYSAGGACRRYACTDC